MPLPTDYASRVYAGVLGKIIGVYLGRPFEGWEHERIQRELGEIRSYVHEKLNVPLIVTDDDVTGTFTFLRAMEDFPDAGRELSAKQIGKTWLNYIIENKTILWWGGMGMSTEHTAYLRLLNGIDAPKSGSIELNGKTVAEQIGAQIFIDGWAMIAPGDPRIAAALARRAASVSHDGEAVHAAALLAAMESEAFVEPDLMKLLDVGLSMIPKDCVIRRMIDDLIIERTKHDDWKRAFVDVLKKTYGYDRYGGNCHVVPNHGVIILALLFGGNDFSESLMIANTAGWDTDCNSGNVGCLMGIKNGLYGIDTKWRSPLADRMYLPTADGGGAISDASRETDRIVVIGSKLAGETFVAPKHGARFHFSYPGSIHGFTTDSPEVFIDNLDGRLCVRSTRHVASVSTPTFVPPDAIKMPGYALLACPTLYSGQVVRATVASDNAKEQGRLFVQVYGADDTLRRIDGPATTVGDFEWQIPDTAGRPIAAIGIELPRGTHFIDRLTWSGEPNVTLRRLAGGSMWQRAWIEATDAPTNNWDSKEDFRLIQNRGRGLLIHGTREWRNVRVTATLTPNLASGFGVATRVQGMRRYFALLATRDQKLKLIKQFDRDETVLEETDLKWSFGEPHSFDLIAKDDRLIAEIDGKQIFDHRDRDLNCGAIALVCEEGRIASGPVVVRPT